QPWQGLRRVRKQNSFGARAAPHFALRGGTSRGRRGRTGQGCPPDSLHQNCPVMLFRVNSEKELWHLTERTVVGQPATGNRDGVPGGTACLPSRLPLSSFSLWNSRTALR